MCLYFQLGVSWKEEEKEKEAQENKDRRQWLIDGQNENEWDNYSERERMNFMWHFVFWQVLLKIAAYW